MRTRTNLRPRGFVERAPTPFGTALVGVRRCGKTYSAIELSLQYPAEEVLYFNFEDPVAYQSKDPSFLSDLMRAATQVYTQNIKLLILDEIQNIPGWERWVRTILEQRTHEIVITGSSASLLSGEISTSLTGRALQIERWPLSFKEFLLFSEMHPQTEQEETHAMNAYLQCGGFPEVILQREESVRKLILKQYFSDLIYRDVLGRHEVRNRRALDQIVLYYFSNPSSLHSYSALKNAFGISIDLASAYTKALSDAFLVFEVMRYHPNLKVQSRDPKKIYVIDSGMQRVVSHSLSPDIGKLLENLVYLELRRRLKQVFYFKEKQEVDFITVEGLKPREAIQVCSGDLRNGATRNREISALLECVSNLNLPTATIVSWDHTERIEVEGRVISIVPAHRWMKGDAPK